MMIPDGLYGFTCFNVHLLVRLTFCYDVKVYFDSASKFNRD